MVSSSVLIASAFALATADFAGDLSAVSASASQLNSLVAAWSSGAGLNGALVIQQSYDPLSSAVSQLNADTPSTSDITGSVDGINGLTGSVAQLLDSLTAKAADFNSVGAFSIVTGDINGLSQTSADIISRLLSIGSGESDAISSVAAGANSLAAAFSSAISAYSASSVAFPSV